MVYNRQFDVGVFAKWFCKIEKVSSYAKINKKENLAGLMLMLQQ